jgi:hypothetical protein
MENLRGLPLSSTKIGFSEGPKKEQSSPCYPLYELHWILFWSPSGEKIHPKQKRKVYEMPNMQKLHM